MKTETGPDDKRLFDQFRSGGMDADGAFIAVQEIRTMAGQNIIDRMDAKFAEQKAETTAIKWLLTSMILFAALLITIGQFYLAFREEARTVQRSESPTADTQAPSP
jgi:hypothetical protein